MTTPPALINLMAQAYYESGRTDAMSLPPWDQVLPHYRAACVRDMGAALKAAEAAGYRIVGPGE